MGQYVAAAPERLVVRMGDDNSGPGPRVWPYLIERDGCHGFLRGESAQRLKALFRGRSRFGHPQRMEPVIGRMKLLAANRYVHQNTNRRSGIVSLSRKSNLSLLLCHDTGAERPVSPWSCSI